MGEAGHRVTAKSWAASPKHPGPKPSLVAAHQRTGFAPQVRPSPTLSVSSSYSLACATAAARASWPRSKIAIQRSMTLTRRRYFAGRITCRWSPPKPTRLTMEEKRQYRSGRADAVAGSLRFQEGPHRPDGRNVADGTAATPRRVLNMLLGDPFRLVPPRRREGVFLCIPFRMIVVPVTHDLIHLATVDTAPAPEPPR